MLRVRGTLVKYTVVIAWLVLGVNAAEARMFGSNEVMSEDLRDFKKWSRMLDRFNDEEREQSSISQQWKKDIKEFAELGSDKAKIDAVHKYVQSKIKYRSDYRVWGNSDYWATPAESYAKGYGDCDDYAIAKYLALKELGFDERKMRIVILRDSLKQEIHAVLTIQSDDEQVYVLDNQQTKVKKDTELAYYHPIYSINNSRWWKHS